jgi:hypothetical protein
MYKMLPQGSSTRLEGRGTTAIPKFVEIKGKRWSDSEGRLFEQLEATCDACRAAASIAEFGSVLRATGLICD